MVVYSIDCASFSIRSCIQCGTFHGLDNTARKNLASGIISLKCTSCGAECDQDPYNFRPTNNARKDTWMFHLIISALPSDRIVNRRPRGEGIHQHLHENASHQVNFIASYFTFTRLKGSNCFNECGVSPTRTTLFGEICSGHVSHCLQSCRPKVLERNTGETQGQRK